MCDTEADKAIKSTHEQKGQKGQNCKSEIVIDLRAEEEEEDRHEEEVEEDRC